MRALASLYSGVVGLISSLVITNFLVYSYDSILHPGH